MKRWIVKAGSSDLGGLVLEDVPLPEPGPGEVRIKVEAVSLNYRDQIVINGDYGQTVLQDTVPISDGAGTIDALGAGVTRWRTGDRVAGLYFDGWFDGAPIPGMGFGLGSPGQDGMLAQYVVLPEHRVIAVPAAYTSLQAATLPCAALTAWTALNGDRPYGLRPVTAEDTVLVLGTGGVSLFALMIARAVGARVIGTSSQDDKLDRLRALGADDTINYAREPAWGETVFARTGGVRRVVNAAGGAALEQSIAAVGFNGEVALMGLFNQAESAPSFLTLMAKAASIRGTSVGSAAAFEDLVAFLDRTGITPPIDSTFAFQDAAEAYRAAASSSVFGKVVIDVTTA